ncbi:copper-binding protein [Noviherbaspirillum sedimenti]|uniref:Copper-binding protein n=1 Tax=Noviherbaspirillum sedimenti TaxID=2320865 RepID=A0A3A3GMH1_9BURK|nr:copper-binding protein [Noviherbaspirillum sedimenti]RJG03496.1 hypothetical protein D3878_19420 [Noviherbaspirillum sedimenti]
MKRTVTLSLVLALSSSSLVFAQSGDMKGMDMKGMDMQKCQDMMKGSDMKGMDMQKCHDMMNGMGNKQQSKSDKAMTHTATAVVKDIDAANGKVTLAHGPVKSLNWPAMTMGFAVKDKALLDKLAVGKKVKVEFAKEGTDYIVTSVK